MNNLRPQTPPVSVDWDTRQNNPVRRVLNALERFSLALESLLLRFVRDPQLNPLYHTGTITVFLLLVILLTGIYLTMFYQFGFETSYTAVVKIEANAVGRVVRALHRYASGAAVIAGLLHGWRTLMQDRFRGARWLAWVSGVVLVVFYWVIGVTGYWLIWDERAQVINQTLIDLFQGATGGVRFLADYLVTSAAGSGWVFLIIVISLHLGLSALVGLFFWLHVKRLNRPKLLPPRYWWLGSLALLVSASLLIPVGMLGRINPAQLPGSMTVDGFFLFYLPAALHIAPLPLYGGGLLATVLLAAIPWLPRRKPLPPILIHEDRCTGCTLCAKDCPYNALKMVARSDGKKHKYVAKIDPALCVSCGICIGACEPLAMTLGNVEADVLWQEVLGKVSAAQGQPVKVVFTCERHAMHGAAQFLQSDLLPHSSTSRFPLPTTHSIVIPLTCIAMAHPLLAVRALEAGASEIEFIGCPPEDCANREGNLWMQQRLSRERLPKLKLAYATAPIHTNWLPPNEFARGLHATDRQSQATAYSYNLAKAGWRKLLPLLAVMLAVLGLQIAFSSIPYTPYPQNWSVVEIAMRHHSGFPLLGRPPVDEMPALPDPTTPTRLVLEVDGLTVLDESYNPGGNPRAPDAIAFEQVHLPSGEHHLLLTLFDPRPTILFEAVTGLESGQILRFDLADQHIGGDPIAGESLYYETSLGVNAGCRICHSLQPNVKLVGPSFAGIATRAETRVTGLSAEEYLRQSILDPNAYIVEGFPAGQMVNNLGEILTDAQVDDLVAFLLTLK